MHCPACALRSSLDWSAPARMCQICPGNVSMLRLACAAVSIKDFLPQMPQTCNPKEKYTIWANSRLQLHKFMTNMADSGQKVPRLRNGEPTSVLGLDLSHKSFLLSVWRLPEPCGLQLVLMISRKRSHTSTNLFCLPSLPTQKVLVKPQ